jgi:hypothetical protein
VPAVLEASFDREPGRPDRVSVRRSDGTEVSWCFPTYGGRLPHDAVHLVVETVFGLRRGFWGLVDAGADPARINEEASRTRDGDRFRGFGDDRRELLVAEALAAVHWYDPAIDDADLCLDVAERCAAFGVEPPSSVTPGRVAGARAALGHLRARWGGSSRREVLTLSFGADDPEGWLADILIAPAEDARSGTFRSRSLGSRLDSMRPLPALPADAREPGAARLTGVTCPDCPGVLTVKSEGHDQLHFECRVGHTFSSEELIADKEQRVERLLWSAVEALEELSALLRDLGGDGERARRALAEAAAVRRIIEETVPARLGVDASCRADGEG